MSIQITPSAAAKMSADDALYCIHALLGMLPQHDEHMLYWAYYSPDPVYGAAEAWEEWAEFAAKGLWC